MGEKTLKNRLEHRHINEMGFGCNNDIQNYEGYYTSVFYSYFAALGLAMTLEDITNLGCIDMTLKFNCQIYIFEFKVVEIAPKGKASRNIVGFEVEQG